MVIKIRTLIILCTVCLLAGIVGSSFFFIRRYRAKCTEITELQRNIDSLQHEFKRETERLRRECEDLNANITAAKRIVESMGRQLDTDTGNINDTINEIRKLREIMQRLKDWSTDSDNSINRDRYSDRSED